jgi:sugar O-acyltransferase (sialic acid O-acetyltransferase NeuD family)
MPNKKEIVLVGGGGHALACLDVIEATNEYHVVGVLDMSPTNLPVPYLGKDEIAPHLIQNKPHLLFINTVGQVRFTTSRRRIHDFYTSIGVQWATVISPLAYVSPHALIGEGSIIMHGAIVNAGAEIGNQCIINTRAIIEHGVSVGDFCHVSTNAVINGDSILGSDTLVGSSATLIQGVRVTDFVVIGANSTVVKSINEEGIYVGSPIRKM